MKICHCAVIDECPVHGREAIETAFELVRRQDALIKELTEQRNGLQQAAKELRAALERAEAWEQEKPRSFGDPERATAHTRSLEADVLDCMEVLWRLAGATKSTKCQPEATGVDDRRDRPGVSHTSQSPEVGSTECHPKEANDA